MDIRKSMVIATVLGASVAAGIVISCSEETAGAGANGTGANHGTGAMGAAGGINFGGSGGEGATVVSDAGPDGDADVCAATTVTAQATPAVMYFLVDRTGSMRCNPPPVQTSDNCEGNPQPIDPNQPSKWEITSTALSAAFATLETAIPLPSVGVAYFNQDNYCGFPSVPDVDILTLSGNAGSDPQLAALQASLAAVAPQGNTPIVGTVMDAYNYLYENAEGFPGNRFVVLLTDGAETCDPSATDFLVQKAQEASWTGIRTFVLGAPGSEGARAFLSQIAYNGNTASDPNCDHSGAPPDVGDCHMDMTLPNMDFATELAANLQKISAQALSCEFDVPVPAPGDPPVDLGKVNVVYTPGGAEAQGQYILQNDALPCDDPNNDGWQYTDNNTKILLCAGACDTVKNDPGATVSIELGCQTHEVPA